MSQLAAIAWDPQVRGAVIVLTAVVILCGSVYLLLATNTGAKVGFLLAAAGLTGWMTLMSISWVFYGIGLKGTAPHWKVIEVATGDLEELGTSEVIAGFPRGWEPLAVGNAILGDAQASADKALAPSEGGEEGGEGAAPAEPEFEPVFDSLEGFVPVGGYRKGGESFYLPGGLIERNSGFLKGWFHKPHHVVIQVAPALEQPDLGGAPPAPAADTTEPLTSVVMVRDLGSLRFPSFVVMVCTATLFGIICNVLHRRDKEIMAARAAEVAAG